MISKRRCHQNRPVAFKAKAPASSERLMTGGKGQRPELIALLELGPMPLPAIAEARAMSAGYLRNQLTLLVEEGVVERQGKLYALAA